MEDHQAVAALKRGDLSGLDALVRRYQTKATRVAYLITRDPSLAEDAMQSAFVQMVDHIHQFDSTRRFEPWFMRIVVNLALKSLGKSSRLSLDLNALELLPASDLEPSAQIEAAELEAAVRRALEALAPEQRAVIVLRYYLGYTESEISAELGSPLGTIRWRLHAAKRMLKGLLHDAGSRPRKGEA